MSQMFRLKDASGFSDGWSPSPPWRVYTKTSEMTRPPPSSLWVIVDEGPDSVNDAAFAVTMGSWPTRYVTIWQDVPATYHGGGCGFSFADGHSEIKMWMDKRTLSLRPTYTRSVTGVTQANPDNPDILWVMERTTAAAKQ